MMEWVNANAQSITVILTIFGGFYVGVRNIGADIDKLEKKMERADRKWFALLKDMHRLDKTVHVMKIQKKSKDEN